ncbi:MAG: hypothetical protein RL274_2880, partial [Pseudomonadota bacterium]
MNAAALRAELAVADYLAAADWSASGAGTPTCLTSYSRGLYDDPDDQDAMPNFPRLVVSTNSARPMQRTDLTCEIEIAVELQLSADDTDEAAVLTTVQVLDNLIHRLEIPPLIAAFTQSPDRLEEYAGHDGHARFVAVEIPELLQHSFPLHPSPAARGLVGASFGAVASLHAAWRHPGAFGRLALQ